VTPADIAADVVEILIASDRRFIASHGTAGLPNYVALVEVGVLPDAQDRVLIPGEPEAVAERRAAVRGLVIDRARAADLAELGRRFGLALPVELGLSS